jgi:hypothetical protein
LIFIPFVVLYLSVISCNLIKNEPDFNVTSTEIYNEFQNNEVAALAKYKGKRVRVSGVLIMFHNTFGVNYCNIGSKGDFRGEVQCAMSDEFAKASSQYQVGQEMWVEGECVGVDLFGVVKLQ